MFSDSEKIAIFDKISEMFYKQNFGSTSKSDFELLLFSEYLDNHIKNDDLYDDYTISKELGITHIPMLIIGKKFLLFP